METKVLLPKSNSIKTGERGIWNDFPDIQTYIQGIQSGEIAENVEAEILNKMVSGVPTPWARTRLFKYAMDYASDQSIGGKDNQGLLNFYNGLIDEWKGLIACLALFPQEVTISEPIFLENKIIKNKANELFQFDKALGRMLFDDADLWTNPDALKNQALDAYPYIQLIYYKGIIIGGISPYTLIFTATNYTALENSNRITWYRNGKFNDPLKYTISQDQKQKLFLLLDNIKQKIGSFEKVINVNRDSQKRHYLTSLKSVINNWLQEIQSQGLELKTEGALDAELAFEKPYYELFNIKKTLYALYTNNAFNGGFSLNKPQDENFVKVEDAKDLLMSSNYIAQFLEEDSENQPLSKAAVYYLEVRDEDSKKVFFPLPLSAMGVYIFQNALPNLLESDPHKIKGEIIEDDNVRKLRVELRLSVQNQFMPAIVREYEIRPVERENGNVVIFPNFTSQYWNSYYYYSEFPTNNLKSFRAYPFYKKAASRNHMIINERIKKESTKIEFVLAQSFTKDTAQFKHKLNENDSLEVERLIHYNPTIKNHKYEIYKSNLPVAGLLIKYLEDQVEYDCGYILVKQEKNEHSEDKKAILDYNDEANFNPDAMNPVELGVDFGSNNTCISYRKQNSDSELMQFNNRRVVLWGKEIIDKEHKYYAEPYELYFFQNEPIQNGQIKSWIQNHENSFKFNLNTDRELVAGVPVFEPNIKVNNLTEHEIYTPSGKIHYNLKWQNDLIGMNHKKGYWNTLWIKICAELYAQKLIPSKLFWSYPGALGYNDRNQYASMYDSVVKRTPISNKTKRISCSAMSTDEAITESEAVCYYALTQITPSSKKLMIGVDVGGSTSDILLLANTGESLKLVSQTSIRLAANQLVKAVKRSNKARQAIHHFIKFDTNLTIRGIEEITEDASKTTYYLNAVFDRMPLELFPEFYKTLGSSPVVQQSALKIFAVPAYLCGLIAFHAGQLVAYTKEAKEEDPSHLKAIYEFDFFSFGKGGRLFDWLGAYTGNSFAKEYYQKCFEAGLNTTKQEDNTPQITFELINNDSKISKNNKAEVALGLLASKHNIEISSKNIFIAGEKGIKHQDASIGTLDLLEARFFKNIYQLDIPDSLEEFEKFMQIYLLYMGPKKQGILDDSAVKKITNRLPKLKNKLITYITNDAEYRFANDRQNDENFSYQHPLIILEGKCFLEEDLMDVLFGDSD